MFKFYSKIFDVNVAASVSTGEQYASTVYKATVKYNSSKFHSHDAILTKLFVKLVVPKVNAFNDENTFETGEKFFWLFLDAFQP